MSQADPGSQDPSQEPSIEEILASIRKIISEDDPPAEAASEAPPVAAVTNDMAPPPAAAPVTTPVDDEDVLELTDFLEEEPLELTDMVEEPAPYVAPEPAIILPEPEPAPMNTMSPEKSWSDDADSDALVSFVSENAATEAMARLAKTAQATQPKPRQPTSSLNVSNRSLDEIVEDMLRPMLAEWLDGNLPLLVEKLVERELNRMARRAEDKA